MDREVLREPTVVGYCNRNFVPVRVDAACPGDAPLRRRLGISDGAPAFLFFGPRGEELDRERGYLSRDELMDLLRAVVAGEHFAALDKRARDGEDGYDFLVAYGRRLRGRGAREAADVLRRVVALDPEARRSETVDARYRLARLAPAEDSVEALAAFAAAHPASPHAIEAHRTLALTYAAREQIDAAVASYEFLRSRGGLDAAWQRHAYARLLAWNGRDLELALALVTEALRTAPDEARWLDTKAECLSRLRRYDEAIEFETRAVEKARDLADRREFERALYEMKKRRIDETGGPDGPAKR